MKKAKKSEADSMVDMAYKETMEFLLSRKKWAGKRGSFLAYGMFNAVFETLFQIAPKEDVRCILEMSLQNFTEEKSNEKM